MKPYTIILADDHILLRDALATLIYSFVEFEVVALASNGEEVIQAFEKGCKPNVILLDLNMPKMDGYETALWLLRNHPDVKILVLTMFDSEIPLIRLLKSGVRGFVKKDIHPTELKNALLAVAGNGYYYSHSTTGKLANFFHKSFISNSSIEKSMLSDKEIEFIKLASTDITYKEIAEAMGLTPRSVDGYRDGIFIKLDIKSRVGLAIYAVKNGIISF